MARATQGKSTGTVDRLKGEAGGLFSALGDRALKSVQGKVEDATSRLTDFAEGNGPGLMAAVTGARGVAEGKGAGRSFLSAGFAGLKEKVRGMFGRGGGGKKKLKLTNIVESIDVGVPVRVAYNQWTSFEDFPTFTKKVESVDRDKENEGKVKWKAQILWSHREWEATIVDQRPDERIVWRSTGRKGHVDGTVTFHELGPALTRVLVVMEYHPQGLFERTGNIWRAQGRRARLELKHFARHAMRNAVLNPDEVEGWRGVIEDGEVVKDHETALGEEGRQPRDQRDSDSGERGEARERGDDAGGDERASAIEPDEGAEAEPENEDEGGAEGEPERPAARRASRASGGSARSRSGSGRGDSDGRASGRRPATRATRGG
jgi:hypothetical protein